MTWYILRSTPQGERGAIASLIERGYHAYCPEETFWRRDKRGQRERFNKPLIPGYLFVRIDEGQSLYFVLQVEKVASVMGVGGTAKPISDKTVEDLRKRQMVGEFDHTPGRKFHLRRGDKARVTKGPFKGHVGELIEADEAGRVKLMLSGLFTGGIALDGDAVEAVESKGEG